jgi:uncharacterized membrane protein
MSQSQSTHRHTKTKKNAYPGLQSDDMSRYAVTVAVPPAEAFAFFRDLENLPTFMKDIKSVEVLSEKKSHWVAQTGAGPTAEWDSEITSERAGEMIAWMSAKGSEVDTSGTIWFTPAPANLGTVISLALDYKIPGGKLAEWFTYFTGDNPEELIMVNLKRLKAVLETGEFATIEGQPSGRDKDAQEIKPKSITH